jgi:hypothetical protein
MRTGMRGCKFTEPASSPEEVKDGKVANCRLQQKGDSLTALTLSDVPASEYESPRNQAWPLS